MRLEFPDGTTSVLIFWSADYMELWEHQVFPYVGTSREDIEAAVKEGFRNASMFTFVTVSYWSHMGKELDSQSFWRREVLGLS